MTAALAIVIALAWIPALDSAAAQQVDAGLKRALISFGTARALNAVISVAQGTEFAIEPAGIGLAFKIGEVLDPVNDLVEQFSTLMLAASVSFGIQKVLITIGAHWLISALLTLVTLCWVAVRFREHSSPGWLSGALVILLMLRFAVPFATTGTDLLFRTFLATNYQSSQQMIDIASGQLGRLNQPAPAAGETPGTMDRLKGWWTQEGDMKSRFESLKKIAEQTIDHIIRLIVIFLLQTLVFPVLLLWVLYGLIRRTFDLPQRSM